MILHGPVLALLLGAVAVSCVLLYSARDAVRILRRWDLHSGSEAQLVLERRTYLITTILTWTFCFQLVSLLLFVYTADDLSQLFVGAMCAAGSFALNEYGYPALILKIVNFLLAGTWLIVNQVDNRAQDYPLIRPKYALLLVITPSVLAEAYLQTRYFLALHPDVITSCCGSLFSAEAEGAQASLFALPREWVQTTFGAAMAATFASGVTFYRRGRAVGGYLFSASGAVTLVVAVAAFISYLCLYFYELPTHNCPFCVFQGEYGHVGYPLYLFLLGGAVPVLGVGALMPFRRVESLRRLVPAVQKRLTLVSLILYGLFLGLVVYRVASSDLVF